jgi:MFS family permease
VTRPGRQLGLLARLRGATLDLTPLKESPAFRRLILGEAVSVVGTWVTLVAVPLQVYALTRSSAAVGLVGVAGLLPLIVFGLYGGAIADAVDRRTLVLVTTTGQLLLAVVLVVQAALDVGSVGLLYLVVAGQAAFSAVDSPARQAFVPRLLRKELLPQRTRSS